MQRKIIYLKYDKMCRVNISNPNFRSKRASHGEVGFPDGSEVKNPFEVQETWMRSLGWEDPLEKEMTTHSSILAWEISLSHKQLDMT